MRADKGGTKSGGFFNIFEWNRKSRKKLFSSVSPEGTNQGKISNENFPTAQFRLVDEDETVGVSSVKGSSDYSCASSVTDEEGNGVRAPGVVARLMGLDSMPTSSVSEPYKTPVFDARSFRDNHCHKRSPEFYINDQFNHVLPRGEGYTRKFMELRSQRMPSSPIERFHTEILPPRSAKSLSMAHNKLLSPIKNPGFISQKNAAHIMEAAAKILEPGLQAGTKSKVSSFESASIPLKARDSKERLAASQRTSRILVSARTSGEMIDAGYLRGQPLNRSWNGSESASAFRRSLESEESTFPSAKSKGKSVSLAIQAKVNVQRREGLSNTIKNTSDHSDSEECKLNQPFKSQPSNQRNKSQRQPSTANASGVLRHNNQKQNCPSIKGKLASKQSIPNQHERKVLSGDAYSGKNKTVNKLSGNSRICYRKEGLETADLDREGSVSSNPQKKRLIERGFHSEKVGFADNLSVGRHEKQVQPNVIIDEHMRWKEDDKRDGMDVVSFTFTSPLRKPMHGSRSSAMVVKKPDKKNTCSVDTDIEKIASTSKDKRLSSHGLNAISGDALSLLLEQKLRELTAGFELSDGSFVDAGSSADSAALMQESGSASNALVTAGAEHDEFLGRPCNKDKPDAIVGFGVSSTCGQVFGMCHKPQGVEEVECSSSSDARKEPDHRHPSPLSVLEASFSNESCISSESSSSTNESKPCSGYAQAPNVSSNSANKTPSTVSETELLDSASSSSFTENMEGEYVSEAGTGNIDTHKDNLNYVNEVLQNTNVAEPLDPLLFDKLENRSSRSSHGDEKAGTSRRKVVFDCVNELMDVRCKRYFQTGYRAWAKGVSVSGKKLAEGVYGEIMGWKSMGDWMVDELVDRDMSNHLGRWVDFEMEAFEAGVGIERGIMNSLVDEVIADFLVDGRLR